MIGEACSAHGGDDKCVQILVGKPERKRRHRRPRHRWEDDIKMDIREIVLEGVDWTHLARDWYW
jgi:hypothetical protein